VAPPLLLADLPWLLYRAYFALPKSITGADGAPVNALLGTVNALLAAEEALAARGGPRAIVACTGAEEAAYRVRLYLPYHAQREPMPAELRAQWQRAPALLGSLGWTIAPGDELEADDVMFSLAREQEERGGEALLLTGDRDLFAATSPSVAVLEMRKQGEPVIVGPAQVVERYGVQPAQVADFIALRGDPSDNIPGAPGIGAKTAATLLREHGSLEALLAFAEHQPGRAAHGLTPRTRATLLENARLLRVFREVATLQRIEVALPPDRPTDYAGGARGAEELGMAALARRLRAKAQAAASATARTSP
jgi:5'-3' exonuclease